MAERTEEILTRPVNPAADEAFLFDLYASTREDLPMLALDRGQMDALLRMQFRAQNDGYAAQYPGADHEIILLGMQLVGRMIVERSLPEMVFVDLAILPEYRGRGIGTKLILDRISEAAKASKVLSFHALTTNRAVRLYLRLGCEIVDDNGVFYRFESRPNGVGAETVRPGNSHD